MKQVQIELTLGIDGLFVVFFGLLKGPRNSKSVVIEPVLRAVRDLFKHLCADLV